MAAVTFTIGGVSFGALSSAPGRYAIDLTVHAPEHHVARFHPPGIDGNYLVLGGRTGQQIAVDVCYVGTLSGIDAMVTSDLDAWAGTLVTVGGVERCLLTPGGGQPRERVRPIGDGTNGYQYWSYVFSRE